MNFLYNKSVYGAHLLFKLHLLFFSYSKYLQHLDGPSASSLSVPYLFVDMSALLGRRTGAGREFAFCIGCGRAQQLLVAAATAASCTSGIVAMRWRICSKE